MFQTGYFADEKTFTKVHVVETKSHDDIKPICGSIIGSGKEFQWCSAYAYYPYIKCEHCKRICEEGSKSKREIIGLIIDKKMEGE